MRAIDHIAVGAPNLDRLCAWFEVRTGVSPRRGGAHGGGQSHNAIVALGPACYLELFAPTPGTVSDDPWIAGSLAAGEWPVFLGWCAVAVGDDLDNVAALCRDAGVDGEGPFAMSRTRPDGVRLDWRLFDPEPVGAAWPYPFFIDWQRSPHPADDAPHGCRLVGIETRAPDPSAARALFETLDLSVPVLPGEAGGNVAIATPMGELRFTSPGS